MEDLPAQMSLTALADRCMREIEKYRQKEPYNDQYCLEIFHLAMVKHDPDAWELLQKRFSPTVRAWMHNHPQRDVACRHQSEEDYVTETFVRVWQASTRNTLEFDSMAAAMRYLKLCLQGAVMDNLRGYSRPKEVPLPDPGSDVYHTEEPAIEDDYESIKIWETIKSLLPNKRERRLAYLLYIKELKAREIVHYFREEFNDIQEIYRLTRKIVEQFHWLLGDSEMVSTIIPAYEGVTKSGSSSKTRERDPLERDITERSPDKILSIPSTVSLSPDVELSEKQVTLSLFALARTNLEDGDEERIRAYVGRAYSVQAGISRNQPEGFWGQPFDLTSHSPLTTLLFDILVHTSENIELTTAWHKHLQYDPNNMSPQLVDFTFQAIATGQSSLSIDYYHERRWLRTIQFQFDAFDEIQPCTVSCEV
jgi:DNA-directed RNA polymerase specialized sigma24 family protein